MFSNPLYSGESQSSMNDEENERNATEVMTEFRGFKPYLKARLSYILESGRSLELQDEVSTIQFYQEEMSNFTADSVHGVDGIRGFIGKLYEMSYRNPIPKSFKKEKKQEELSGDADSDVPENSEFVEVAKLRKKGKEFRDWSIKETLRKWDEDVAAKPGNWYHEVMNASTAVGSIPSTERPSSSPMMGRREPLMANQTQGRGRDELEFLRDAEPENDILVAAGISELVERRQKKVTSILKDPPLRTMPMPTQDPPIHQAIHQQQPTRSHHQQSFHEHHPSSHYAAPQPQQSYTSDKPHWFFDQPMSSDDGGFTSTSYDCARSMQNNSTTSVPRQAPLTSTYIPGYGHVKIVAPLQPSSPPPPPPPSIPYQQYEYNVPRDLHPNPCYDPVHQPQPMMMPPPHTAYHNPYHVSSNVMNNRGKHPFKRMRGKGSKFSSAETSHPLNPAQYPNCDLPSNAPDFYNDDGDDDTTSSFSSVSSTRPQYQNNRGFQRKSRGRGAPFRKQRYFHNDHIEKDKVKRVTINEPEKSIRPIPMKNPSKQTSLSHLRQKFAKECSAIFKLGTPKKGEEAVEDTLVSCSTEDTPESESSPPSPVHEDQDQNLQVIAEILSTHGKKKECSSLLNNPDKLKKYCDKIKSDIKAREEAKKANSTRKPTTSPRPPKKFKSILKSKSKLTLQDIHDTLVNGFSSESETGSVVSSVSTRSSARKQNSSTSSNESESSPKRITRNMSQASSFVNKAVKSTTKRKNEEATPSRRPPPRKRIVAPLQSSSESETEQEVVTSSSAEEAVHKKLKLHAPAEKDTPHFGNSKRVREAVEELRMENMRKKKTSSDQEAADEMSRRKFQCRTAEKGLTLVGKHDIIVCRNINKINLGSDDNSGIAGAVKFEKIEKQETDAEMDAGQDDLMNDPFICDALSHVEVQYDFSDGDDVGSSKTMDISEVLETLAVAPIVGSSKVNSHRASQDEEGGESIVEEFEEQNPAHEDESGSQAQDKGVTVHKAVGADVQEESGRLCEIDIIKKEVDSEQGFESGIEINDPKIALDEKMDCRVDIDRKECGDLHEIKIEMPVLTVSTIEEECSNVQEDGTESALKLNATLESGCTAELETNQEQPNTEGEGEEEEDMEWPVISSVQGSFRGASENKENCTSVPDFSKQSSQLGGGEELEELFHEVQATGGFEFEGEDAVNEENRLVIDE